MDRYQSSSMPRRRRCGPTPGRRRRARALPSTRSTLLWGALALLLLALLTPRHAVAQGLRSTSASVTLLAVRRDPASVQDLALPLPWTTPVSQVVVRLRRGEHPLYFRAAGGRLERLDGEWREAPVGTLHFRAIQPGGWPLDRESWQVELRAVDGRTGDRLTVERLLRTR